MTRWIALAVVLGTVLGAHHGLGSAIDGAGAEAVGVALGPGTPPAQLLLVGAYLLSRLLLYFALPFLAALAALMPRKARANEP